MTIRVPDNLQFILTSHLHYIIHPFRDQTKPEYSSLLRTLKDRWSIVTTERLERLGWESIIYPAHAFRREDVILHGPNSNPNINELECVRVAGANSQQAPLD